MNALIECIGWVGAVLVLAAYGLLSLRKLSSNGYCYHYMNMGGSLLLATYAFCKNAQASVAVNVIWLLIGIGAVLSLHRGRRNNAPMPLAPVEGEQAGR